tara:strand:+ start:286 stop:519 length:234 start_codon:yes stop_codon:yes gene_type:complete
VSLSTKKTSSREIKPSELIEVFELEEKEGLFSLSTVGLSSNISLSKEFNPGRNNANKKMQIRKDAILFMDEGWIFVH